MKSTNTKQRFDIFHGTKSCYNVTGYIGIHKKKDIYSISNMIDISVMWMLGSTHLHICHTWIFWGIYIEGWQQS